MEDIHLKADHHHHPEVWVGVPPSPRYIFIFMPTRLQGQPRGGGQGAWEQEWARIRGKQRREIFDHFSRWDQSTSKQLRYRSTRLWLCPKEAREATSSSQTFEFLRQIYFVNIAPSCCTLIFEDGGVGMYAQLADYFCILGFQSFPRVPKWTPNICLYDPWGCGRGLRGRCGGSLGGAKWDPQPAIDCPTLKWCTSFPIKRGDKKMLNRNKKYLEL